MSLLGRLQQGGKQEDEPPGQEEQPPQTGLLRRGALPAGPGSTGPLDDRLRTLKRRIQNRLIEELRPAARRDKPGPKGKDQPPGAPRVQKSKLARRHDDAEALRERVQALFNQFLAEEHVLVSRSERKVLFEQIVADILGYGPIDKLLADPATSDIMVIGPRKVYVDRGGRLYRTTITFDNDEHLMQIIERIMGPLGRRIDDLQPMADARLPDGSRVHAVIPPIALEGPCLTIRKFSEVPLKTGDLVRLGTVSTELMEFLSAAVQARLNIMICGGSSSGKTTLLNVLCGYMNPTERVVTIETAAELQLQHAHVVRLETRPPSIEGTGELGVRDLMINSLRMRPDRIIVGEVRGPEALDLLQAMNAGRDGSMGTIHANSPTDALARLEVMALSAGMGLSSRPVREQIAAAIDLVIHIVRLRDGSRRVMHVSEVTGMEGDTIMVSDLFDWYQTHVDREGFAQGVFRPTGIVPRAIHRIEDIGIYLPPSMFGVTSFSQERRARKEFRAAPDAEAMETPSYGTASTAPPPEPDAPPETGEYQ